MVTQIKAAKRIFDKLSRRYAIKSEDWRRIDDFKLFRIVAIETGSVSPMPGSIRELLDIYLNG